ncbi:iron-dicitrate transporter substrate-binding subunit [Gallibacterium salpingitidis]|uniref:Iron-dicitrate transporter substrate-binding subunit n=1 Tax=Gallibacterium salpingitidis TaxID=505341 RepID=A0A1A7Q4M1_9PAST|nr:Fe(3+) dicitrate ABC transporter substrate-binding protein [Gallibacterium salpingitidis]OBW91874.1 iron-dicitrate transporter substrate-binding subunit [Gallibacterium salpingitidis]OBX09798.1 iron-dicitrate transporter substrate-binding subunit [Gallibacterium salpingitidis]OBX11323.1 iron-dicitrate transporter substrate-binding subunit [Gallibacterium salpingitidis]WKS99240.1 Fe(3+) dicitrate ABC transporter substrate-binding protein [Gallibacterium salpingitidis]
MLHKFRYFFTLTVLLCCSFSAIAVTVKDAQGEFTINTTPKRVVALEYSFVDSLANVGVSPVGVADDNDKTRILQSVRNKINDWKSVGTRSQPSLEAIAELKPDLIIADQNRHSAVYEELKKIAPTLLLKSRKETYQDNLVSAQTIADVVGKSQEMQARIKQHKEKMAEIAKSLPKVHATIGISRETSFLITTNKSYTGSLLEALGFTVDKPLNTKDDANNPAGLEQLATSNPDWLIIVHYRDESIAKKWATEPLWQALTAVQKNQVINVNDAALWTRSRGLDAAENIAETLQKTMTK